MDKINRTKINKITELKFRVPEYFPAKRSLVWFILIFIVFASLIVFSIRQSDYSLAITLGLGVIVFYQLAVTSPQNTLLIVNPKGIDFRGRYLPWSEFRSFSVFKYRAGYNIHLDKKSTFSGPLVVPVPDNKNGQLVLIALRYLLPEKLQGKMGLGEWLSSLIRY